MKKDKQRVTKKATTNPPRASFLIYSTAEAEKLLYLWGSSEPLPEKGKRLRIAFPKPSDPNTAIVTLYTKGRVRAGNLYKVEYKHL